MYVALVQPMSNYAMAYPQQPGMVGLPTAIPGTQSDMTAYAPMQPTTFPFGAQQYPNPYQGQMMGHQGQSYPSPIAPLIGMNNAQAAAAAVRTSVGPQTEGIRSSAKYYFLQFFQAQYFLCKFFSVFVHFAIIQKELIISLCGMNLRCTIIIVYIFTSAND